MKPDRIAVVGIIVEQTDASPAVNEILHQYSSYIIGRMGIPYREKRVNVISVVLDAPADVISAMSGKLGRIPGVSSKALYSRQGSPESPEKENDVPKK
jgi:putative iron-only hydrogenase system regulator